MLKNVGFKVFPGDILAVVGDNGSGKTTLAKTIAGLLKPVGGEILIKGRSISLPDALLCNMVFQDVNVMLFNTSVESEISFGLDRMPIPDKEHRINYYLKLMDLNGLIDMHPHKLSSGQKLRLALATVLALSPEIIILDEPVRGQDWRHLDAFMRHIKRYIEEERKSCILITHEYKVIHHYANRIMLMENGRISKQGICRREH